MAEWSRETPWRQGQIISGPALRDIFAPAGLSDIELDVAIIASHDCDIAGNITLEPEVEFIFGRLIESTDGNFTHAKNARRLHLNCSGGTTPANVELLATEKRILPKALLVDFKPQSSSALSLPERAIFQRWLKLRYTRAAFPDRFNDLLAEKRIDTGLSKILKPLSSQIAGLCFDLDRGESIERGDGDEAYDLFIYVLFVEDGVDSHKQAGDAAKKIQQLFEQKFFDPGSKRWVGIECSGCEPISSEAMTVALNETLRRWSADHISMKASPHDPILDGDPSLP